MHSNGRKHAVLLALVSVALVALAVVTVLSRSQAIQPTPAQLQSVRVGLTREQAHDAVGVSPGNYPLGAQLFWHVGVKQGNEVWRCAGTGELHVWYDKDGRVADAVVYQSGVEPPVRFRVRIESKH